MSIKTIVNLNIRNILKVSALFLTLLPPQKFDMSFESLGVLNPILHAVPRAGGFNRYPRACQSETGNSCH